MTYLITGAKIRWESLRAQYRKYLAKLKTKSGQAAAKISKWRYCDQMQFLNDYLTVDRPRLSSVVDEDLDNENSRSEDSEEVLAHATSLRQNNDHEEAESVNDSGHPVDQSGSTSARSPSGTQKKKMKRNINPENASSNLMKYILENK